MMGQVSFEEACRLLREGQPVAIPTETVYGLAAPADNPSAIARIFEIKGRPTNHPLIVHVELVARVGSFGQLDSRALDLMRAFWPGPLTIVVPRQLGVHDLITGGQETVALRAPAHPLARRLIQAVGPLVAPSANRFGQLSPTAAGHVLAALPGVPVLDGGACEVGVESTIVDLSNDVPAILRPGKVTEQELGMWLGPLGQSKTVAPGTLAAHYAPETRLILSTDADSVVARLLGEGLRVGRLRAREPEEYARVLYEQLRRLDKEGFDVVVAEPATEVGIGRAVNDRLRRAAASF